MDFWISEWISGFQIGFLDFWISQWISGFQFGFLPTVYEISFVTDPSAVCVRVCLHPDIKRNSNISRHRL